MSEFRGGDGDDVLVWAGEDQDRVKMWGFAGDDLLQGPRDLVMVARGGSGDDTIRGGGTTFWGWSSFFGGPGNDYLVTRYISDPGPAWTRLDGGRGRDTMVGGEYDDDFVVDNPGDVVRDVSQRDGDYVHSSVSFWLSANLEHLSLTGDRDIRGVGNDGRNFIFGNEARNLLAGGAGSDELFGDDGADTLWGGLGSDSLSGESTPAGGDGAADVYEYRSVLESKRLLGRDVVVFRDNDRIDLSGIDAVPATAAVDDAFVFIGNAAFDPDATGQVRLAEGKGSFVRLLVSTDADPGAEMVILLSRPPALSAADFIL